MSDNKKPLIPMKYMLPIGIGYAAVGLFGIIASILLKGGNKGIFTASLIFCFGLPSIIGWTTIAGKILHDRGIKVFPEQIIDDSPPVPESWRPFVFEDFMVPNVAQHTGDAELELAHCASIVRKLGGNIEASFDGGVQYRVSLPSAVESSDLGVAGEELEQPVLQA